MEEASDEEDGFGEYEEYAYAPLQYINIPDDPDNVVDGDVGQTPGPIVMTLSKSDEIPEGMLQFSCMQSCTDIELTQLFK